MSWWRRFKVIRTPCFSLWISQNSIFVRKPDWCVWMHVRKVSVSRNDLNCRIIIQFNIRLIRISAMIKNKILRNFMSYAIIQIFFLNNNEFVILEAANSAPVTFLTFWRNAISCKIPLFTRSAYCWGLGIMCVMVTNFIIIY